MQRGPGNVFTILDMVFFLGITWCKYAQVDDL